MNEQPEQLASIADLRWSKRVILVRAADGASAMAERLEAAKAGVDDRRIVWFVLEPGKLHSNSEVPMADGFRRTAEALFEGDPKAAVVLVGLDGGVKARADRLDLEALFARIDAMPMRREELRRRDE